MCINEAQGQDRKCTVHELLRRSISFFVLRDYYFFFFPSFLPFAAFSASSSFSFLSFACRSSLARCATSLTALTIFTRSHTRPFPCNHPDTNRPSASIAMDVTHWE